MLKYSLSSLNPVFSIEDGVVATRKGCYSIVYELMLKPVFSLTKNDYEGIVKAFDDILSFLPENAILHKMDVFYKDIYRFKKNDNFKTDDNVRAYALKFNERDFMAHKCYITIAKTTSKFVKGFSKNTSVYNKNLIEPEFLDKKVLEAFKDTAKQIEDFVGQSPYFLGIRRLDESQLKSVLACYFNLDFGNTAKDYKSDILFKNNDLVVGEKQVAMLSVNNLMDLPKELQSWQSEKVYATKNSSLHFSFLYPIGLGFKENHIVNQVFVKPEVDLIKKELNSKLKMINSFQTRSMQIREQEGFTNVKKEQTLEFLSLIEEHKLTPIKTHVNVFLYDMDRAVLENQMNVCISKFKGLGIQPAIVNFEKLPLYYACMPSNIADIGVQDQCFTLLSQQASCLNIFESVDTASIQSDFGIYLSDRQTGVPFLVDISDLPMEQGIINNRNKIVVGPSGSGKSFFTNHLVHNYLKQDAHVLIVDVGYSYDRLVMKEKGVFYNFSEKEPLEFNPFYITEGKLPENKKQTLLSLIFSLWKKNVGEETKDESAIISKSIDSFYQSYFDPKGEVTNLSFNDFYEYFLKNKESIDTNLFNVASFKNVLQAFYKGGEYDYLLNAEDKIDLTKEKFIVFELDNIKDHPILFPVVTLVIMDTFLSKMYCDDLAKTKKVILIEEAWKAIAKEGMAEFILYLYKTLRKFYGEAILVTQELDDILKSELIKEAIVKNSDTKILLDMSKYANNFDAVQSILSLLDHHKDLILSMNKNNGNKYADKYKEVFISLGDTGRVFKVNLSLIDYFSFTTEKKEKKILEDHVKKTKDIDLSVRQMAYNRKRGLM